MGDVREHADLIRDIIDEHPDWVYKRIGAQLGEVLGVTLESKDYQAVLRVQKAEPAYEDFAGDVREHVDAIKDLMEQHPDKGYKFIGRQLGEQLRVKLSESHRSVIRRIIRSIRGQQDVDVDVRDHVDAIKKLLGQHLGKSYTVIGSKLGEQLGVNLCDAQVQIIRRIMTEIAEELSEHCVRDRDGYPLRCVWQDRVHQFIRGPPCSGTMNKKKSSPNRGDLFYSYSYSWVLEKRGPLTLSRPTLTLTLNLNDSVSTQ